MTIRLHKLNSLVHTTAKNFTGLKHFSTRKSSRKFNSKGSFKGRRKLRGKSSSSSQWLQRQDKDQYVTRRDNDGYPSRAAYKLIEIQDKHKVIRDGSKVLDLGCSPGSWLMVSKKLSSNARVVGLDILSAKPIDGVEIIQGDFQDSETSKQLSELLDGTVDTVLSDMSPNLTGISDVDQENMRNLQLSIIDFLPNHLSKGGNFVTKAFRGPYDKEVFDILKKRFRTVKREKPSASRSKSKEIYFVGLNFQV
eukprot:g13553.t1